MASHRTIGRRPRGQSKKGVEGRLWEKISPEPNSGCWLWIGGRHPRGYGGFYINGKTRPAHVVCYEVYVGAVPDGLELDHKCRVTCCVNPDHLEPVTHQENMSRGIAGKMGAERQLAKKFCPSGHAYTPDNIYYRPNGYRDCKVCAMERKRRAKDRHKV